MENSVEPPYQQWLPVEPNTQQPILSYLSNASTFQVPGYSENDIYAASEIVGSSHFTMTSENDGYGTTLPQAFPTYDANNLNLHSYGMSM